MNFNIVAYGSTSHSRLWWFLLFALVSILIVIAGAAFFHLSSAKRPRITAVMVLTALSLGVWGSIAINNRLHEVPSNSHDAASHVDDEWAVKTADVENSILAHHITVFGIATTTDIMGEHFNSFIPRLSTDGSNGTQTATFYALTTYGQQRECTVSIIRPTWQGAGVQINKDACPLDTQHTVAAVNTKTLAGSGWTMNSGVQDHRFFATDPKGVKHDCTFWTFANSANDVDHSQQTLACRDVNSTSGDAPMLIIPVSVQK